MAYRAEDYLNGS